MLGPPHPAAAAASGKALTSLSLIDGRIYAGYGTLDTDGPLAIMSVPASSPLGAWEDDLASMDNSQLGIYRGLLNGDIITPDMADTAERDSLGLARRTSGVWSDHPTDVGLAEHIFDMVEYDGLVWACGGDNDAAAPGFGGAAVWVSADHGATWVQSLVGPRATAADGIQRFCCFVIADGVMRVREPVGGQSYKWTGSAWATDTVNPLPDV